LKKAKVNGEWQCISALLKKIQQQINGWIVKNYDNGQTDRHRFGPCRIPDETGYYSSY
jgi:hypothetical protein